jgi:hypothetical protein
VVRASLLVRGRWQGIGVRRRCGRGGTDGPTGPVRGDGFGNKVPGCLVCLPRRRCYGRHVASLAGQKSAPTYVTTFTL